MNITVFSMELNWYLTIVCKSNITPKLLLQVSICEAYRQRQILTCMYSLKRVHWELGMLPFWEGVFSLLTLQLGVDEEEDEEDDEDDGWVLEEARVCMQDSTTLDTAASRVRPQLFCLWELLDSWKIIKK